MQRVIIDTSWEVEHVRGELRAVERELSRNGAALVIRASTTHAFLEEFAITVVGGIAVETIARLIDAAIQKFGGGRRSIKIRYEEDGASFELPRQKTDALAHIAAPRSKPVSPEERNRPASGDRIYIPTDFDLTSIGEFPNGSFETFAHYNDHLQAVIAQGGVSHEPHEAARAQLAIIIHYCRQKRVALPWGSLFATMMDWTRSDSGTINLHDSAKRLIEILLDPAQPFPKRARQEPKRPRKRR